MKRYNTTLRKTLDSAGNHGDYRWFYYFYYGDMKSSGYILAMAILWALLSPKIMMLDLRRQILKNYTIKKKSICSVPIP